MFAVLTTFAIFTCFSACAYVLNDIIDRSSDASHPTKRFRPIAFGAVSPLKAGIFAAVIFLIAVLVMRAFVPAITGIMTAYAVLAVFYTLILKNIPLVDIFTVSSFYLLRVAAGGAAIDIIPSRWLVACVMFFALFIVLGKRRAECVHSEPRAVLALYGPDPDGMRDMLDRLILIAAAVSIASYGAYAILAVESDWTVYSLFFVMFGVFRYIFLIYHSAFAESAEVALMKDMPLFLSVFAWILFMYVAVYHFV